MVLCDMAEAEFQIRSAIGRARSGLVQRDNWAMGWTSAEETAG